MAAGELGRTVGGMTENPTAAPEILVVGGGIAALEFVLALRDLAGDRLRVTIVAPEPDFVSRPMLVAEPLGLGEPQSIPLSRIASDLGCRLVPAAVASVDPARRRVVLHSGATVSYDTLVLAPGTRTIPAFDGVISLGDTNGVGALEEMREEIRRGIVRSVAFVAPTQSGWLLPLYEAALITANSGDPVRVSLVTPEQRPLELFGGEASATVARALDAAGVEFIGDQRANVSAGTVWLPGASRASLSADRIVSLPLSRGLRLSGVPATGLYGLIPVDPYGRVDGLPDAYAAGDATDFPLKQGGIACQQADAVAANIAARHGVDVAPARFAPVLRATLLTGHGPPIALGAATESIHPAKLPGRYLAPYLQSHAELRNADRTAGVR
jgi:sulfide:quinone oxidoreductase